MIGIDTAFARVSASDNVRTDQTISTSVASIDTRTIECTSDVELVMPSIHISDKFRIDTSPFVNRPFYVETVPWDSTKTQYSILTPALYHLPRDVFRSNPSLLSGLKIGSLYRSDLDLQISVAGTITHAGCVLVGVIPPLDFELAAATSGIRMINTILSGPHAFLHANEASSVCLKVPWYCNTDLDSLDAESTATYIPSVGLNTLPCNQATLVFVVMNPLAPSDGSSTTLNITVEAIFNNLDIYVPTPRYVTYQAESYFTNLATGAFDGAAKFAKTITGDAIDGMRGWIRSYTGLHNPNTPIIHHAVLTSTHNRFNNVDVTSFAENLDPYANMDRVVSEPIFHSLQDEMATNHIIGKRQYIGYFRVNQNDAVGTRLMSRPIGPFQGGFFGMYGGPSTRFANNIELMAFMSRAWKGSIKIHIQSVMNNKQQVKLRLLQMYNPSAKIRTSYPVYNTILQAPSHLMEFTAGGQTQTITLPYLSRNRLMPIQKNFETTSLLHGQYYVYLAQPLANSSGSPEDINFNVYMELCDDFAFYGYSTEIPYSSPIFNTPRVIPPPVEAELPTEEPRKFRPESLEVMNAPSNQKETVHKFIPSDDSRLVPILDVRPIIRRLYPSAILPYRGAAGESVGVTVQPSFDVGEAPSLCNTPTAAICRMYYGKHAGLKYRIEFVSEEGYPAELQVKIFFSPTTISACSPFGGTLGSALYSGGPTQGSGYEETSQAQYPLNCIKIPSSSGRLIYEFTIPNTSMFKFVGGPSKMNEVSTGYQYACEGLGEVFISLRSEKDFKGNILVESALTDESRLGFHCIAPIVDWSTIQSVTGAWANPNTHVTTVGNPAIAVLYYTRF